MAAGRKPRQHDGECHGPARGNRHGDDVVVAFQPSAAAPCLDPSVNAEVALLEAGDYEPSLATLSRLAKALGLEFHIHMTPDAFGLRDTA